MPLKLRSEDRLPDRPPAQPRDRQATRRLPVPQLLMCAILAIVTTLPGALRAAGSAGPGDWPPTALAAVYAVKALGASVGETRWTIAGAGPAALTFESVTEPSGLYALVRSDVVRERSDFTFSDTTVVPQHYRYSRTGGKRDRHVSVDFDWARRTATSTAKGRTWSMPLPEGTLDKLTYVLALMRDLRNGVREMRYAVADGGELTHYRLQVGEKAVVETPLGSFRAVKVERLDQDRRHTVLWCAPALGFLPVRIEHRERDGAELVVVIREVHGAD